jgi:hypothetical protein
LLRAYIDGTITDNITGYYAFACINPDNTLTVLRDDIATLFISWSEDYNTFAIATTIDLLNQLDSRLNLNLGEISEVADLSYATFELNNIIVQGEFYSRGYDYKQASLASKSLGRDIGVGGEIYDYSGSESSHDWDNYKMLAAVEDFLAAVSDLDDSATIYNANNKRISARTFHELDLKDKRACYIETEDLEIICFEDFVA